MTRTKGAKDKTQRNIEPALRNLEKARANSPISQANAKKVFTDPKEMEFNSRLIKFMGEVVAANRPNPNDVETMEKRFNFYLSKCDEYNIKPTNQGAYAAIGISQDDVNRWFHGGNANIDVVMFVKKVKQIMALYRETSMTEGKLNPVVGIFHQKNYDGLRDQQEIVAVTHTFQNQEDPSKLKQKYLDASYMESDLELTDSVKQENELPVIDVDCE